MYLIQLLCTVIDNHTLNDGQQDDNDKEEEGNVKDDAIHLVRVTSRVFDFITNAATRSHSHIHVEEVALGKMVVAVQVKGEWLSRSMVTSHYTSEHDSPELGTGTIFSHAGLRCPLHPDCCLPGWKNSYIFENLL